MQRLEAHRDGTPSLDTERSAIVKAADASKAIAVVIEEFELDPRDSNRLIAQPVLSAWNRNLALRVCSKRVPDGRKVRWRWDFERGIDQGFPQVAMVIAAPPAATVPVPVHGLVSSSNGADAHQTTGFVVNRFCAQAAAGTTG